MGPHYLVEDYVILPVFITLFILIYTVAYFTIFTSYKDMSRFEASSCSMSFIHSTICTALCAYNLFNRKEWIIDGLNEPFDNIIMAFSSAYFCVDLLHYLLFNPQDFKFIIHHITSCYFFGTSRYMRHGALACICFLCVGEVTTPLHSMWTISRLGKEQYPVAKLVYEHISIPFTILFTITRGFISPWLTVKYSIYFISSKVFPLWLSISWIFLASMGVLGSITWLLSLWKGMLKFINHHRVPEMKIN